MLEEGALDDGVLDATLLDDTGGVLPRFAQKPIDESLWPGCRMLFQLTPDTFNVDPL